MASKAKAYICTGCHAIYWHPVTSCDCEELPNSLTVFIEAKVSWKPTKKTIVCLQEGKIVTVDKLRDLEVEDAENQ